MHVHAANIALHVGAGALALVVGLVPLCSRKGGEAHRRFGRWFRTLGTVVVATAVFGVLFGDAPMALAAVTLSAGYQFVGGLRVLALRDRPPGWPDALMACAAIALAALVLLRPGPAATSWPPVIAYSTLGYLGAVVAYDLSRHAWADLWRRRARPLDHGLKLTAAYFGMASAGGGNLLRSLQPWSALLPSAIGMTVMAAFAIVHLRRRTGAGAIA